MRPSIDPLALTVTERGHRARPGRAAGDSAASARGTRAFRRSRSISTSSSRSGRQPADRGGSTRGTPGCSGWTSASRPATIGSSRRRDRAAEDLPPQLASFLEPVGPERLRPRHPASSKRTRPPSGSRRRDVRRHRHDAIVFEDADARAASATDASGVNGTGCPFGSPMSAPAITSSSSLDVVHRSRHRPDDAGEREGTAAGREVSGGRHAARRRLEAADAAEVRRHANRSAAVAADAAGRQARGDGRRFAAARSARRAIERPRVVRPAVERVVGLPRHELLGNVRHAEHDGARGLEACDQRWRRRRRRCPRESALPVSHGRPFTEMELLMLTGTPQGRLRVPGAGAGCGAVRVLVPGCMSACSAARAASRARSASTAT